MEVCKLPKSNTPHKTIIRKLLINKQLIQALRNMKKKELYTAPQTESIALMKEAVMQNASPGLWDNSLPNGTNWGGGNTDYGLE